MALETATFAAGCFWGVEEAFRNVKGVISTEVGYTGGRTENPTYRDVCRGDTGHAEAVNIAFDPAVVSLGELLDAFWNSHDPTTRNRQGPDIGSQYRSAVFYHSGEQRTLAEEAKAELEKAGRFRGKIVTEIVPAGRFWRAEEYQQKYFMKNGRGCHLSF